VLHAYIDESRSGNQRIFALGGWLGNEHTWTAIQDEWHQRIELEKRISTRKGFPPISRFHASDLSNLRGEFSKSKGWNQERQKRFIKKLIEILTRKRSEPLVGISMAVIMDDWQTAYKKREWAEKNVFHFLLVRCAHLMGEAVANRWPEEKVSIFHDHGPFNEAAQAAFRSIKNDIGFPERHCVATVAPRLWQDCIALQSADLLAYEGHKSALLGLTIADDEELQRCYRRSLQKLLSGKATLRGLCYPRFFEHILEERRKTNSYPLKTAAAPT
jgi:hypothetical protein